MDLPHASMESEPGQQDAARWVKVASLDVFDERNCYAALVGESHIGLFRIEGKVYAIDNICTHGHAMLTEGELDGALVECPFHAGLFDVRTGMAMGPPVVKNARTFPVRIDGDDIFVALDP